MKDPIKPVMEEIKKLHSFREVRKFTSSFLDKISEAYESYGYETTRLHLLNQTKKSDTSIKYQAEALIDIIDVFDRCPEIQERRSIGSTIIKALKVL